MSLLIELTIPVCAILMMFVVGLDLSMEDFRRVRKAPKALLAGVIGQIVLLPIVALLLVQLFTINAVTMAGVLLLAACPAGGISNYYTYLARGNTALSVTMTVISCLAAVVTMPLILKFYEWMFSRPFGFELPIVTLVLQLILMVGIPIAVGMLLRNYKPQYVQRNKLRFHRIGLLAITGLIILIVYQDIGQFGRAIVQTAPLAVSLIALMAVTGYTVATLCRLSRQDRVTLAIEYPVRNLAIASVMAVTLLGQAEYMRFSAVYFLVEVVIILLIFAAYQCLLKSKPGHAILSAYMRKDINK